MYKPKHFKLQEFFSERFYNNFYPRYGHLLWQVMDERVLITCDQIRDEEGPLIMNTWHSYTMIKFHGRHEWRGFRDPSCEIGSVLSQHKFGRAGDSVPLETTAERIRRKMINDPSHYKFITCIEKDVSWLHFDCGNRDTGTNAIKIVKP